MTDPFSIERHYQTLRHTLSLLTGPRNRLLHLLEFIEALNEPHNRTSFPAYADELVSLLAGSIREVNFTGTPPYLAQRAAAALDALELQGPGSRKRYTIVDARSYLDRRQDRLPLRGSGPGREAVTIPMVEREYLVPGFAPRFASLCLLVVDLRLKESPGPDEIHVAQFTRAGAGDRALEDAMRAARAALLRWKGVRIPAAAVAYCSLGGPAAVEGGSLGSGLSVAVLCALLRAVLHREEFRPSGDVAFTGVVDQEGTLLPVEERGLRLKVEACWHSPIRFLVVPEPQRRAAETRLQSLQGLRPGAHDPLTIIGVTRVEEIFFDRRLMSSRIVPAPVHLARRVWRRRRPLAALLLVVLLSVIGRLWYGPLDRDPVSLDYAGSEMLIENSGGTVIQRITIGKENVDWASRDHTLGTLYDIDGDGAREVLWCENRTGEPGAPGTLRCRTVGHDSDRWRMTVRKDLRFPENPPNGDAFKVFSLAAGDFSGTGRPEVLVVARHQDYPSLLLKLDARTGAEISSYVHAGHITSFTIVEPDSGGPCRILLTGANNAYGEAFLAMLDARSVTGHGPVRGRYRIDGIPPAEELSYLLIPRTIVHEAFPDRVQWNMGGGISRVPSTGAIRITVREYAHDANADHDHATYYPLFSSTCEPLGVQTGDDFDALAARYVREGRIRKIPDVAYWAEFMKRIRIRDGDRWKSAVGSERTASAR